MFTLDSKRSALWVAFSCFALVTVLSGQAHGQTGIQTQAPCSPVIVQSQITGKVTVLCGAGRADLARLEERLNTLIDESRLTHDQVGELARLFDDFADARAGHGRLAGVMATWVVTALKNLTPVEGVSKYMALIDSDDPGFSVGAKDIPVYVFYAMDSWEIGDEPSCKIDGDHSVLGLRFAGQSKGGDQIAVRATATVLPQTDPLLKRICYGMGRPLTTIMTTKPNEPAATQLTIYDYLLADKSMVALVLTPGGTPDARADTLRTFWSAAFVERQFGSVPNVEVGPEAFAAQNGASPDGLPTGKGLAIDLTVPALDGIGMTYDRPYSDAQRAEFGADLEKMDAAWLDYIAPATVTVRGRTLPLFLAGKAQPVLHIYRSSDVASTTFWIEAGDGLTVMRQEACKAARFAVDKGYANATELPGYAECGTSMYAR